MSAPSDLVPRAAALRFVRFFGALWLAYDLLDVVVHGTESITGAYAWPVLAHALLGVQLALVAAELAVVLLPRPWLALGLLAVVRGIEVLVFFRLNDFVYCGVTAVVLTQLRPRDRGGDSPAWPRQVLRGQTAWIYFATAVLKLNQGFLSGGNLWVRHQYLATAQHWPYPGFYRRWVDTLSGNAALAWAGVAAELTLALLLAVGAPRRLTLPLAVGIHAFGALAMNVWFFGASMVAQVAFVCGAEAAWSRPLRSLARSTEHGQTSR